MRRELAQDKAGDSREYPYRPICGVGVVVRKSDAVLLIQRGNAPRRGDWGLPGGVVELGETLRDAARREVCEECGIEIALGDLIDTFEVLQRDDSGRLQYHYVIIDFTAEYVGGELRAASDVLDARWVDCHNLDVFLLPTETRRVIQKALSH
jgi:ADP-ribose pyrophosphatase